MLLSVSRDAALTDQPSVVHASVPDMCGKTSRKSGTRIFQLHDAIPSICLTSAIHSSRYWTVSINSVWSIDERQISARIVLMVVIRRMSKIPMKFCVHANKYGTSLLRVLGGASAIGHMRVLLMHNAASCFSSSVVSSGQWSTLYTKGRYMM